MSGKNLGRRSKRYSFKIGSNLNFVEIGTNKWIQDKLFKLCDIVVIPCDIFVMMGVHAVVETTQPGDIVVIPGNIFVIPAGIFVIPGDIVMIPSDIFAMTGDIVVILGNIFVIITTYLSAILRHS